MERNQLTTIDTIRQFALAGDAIFTVVNPITGNSFTYRLQASEDGRVTFVKVLTGPNNTQDYGFTGTLFEDGMVYRHSAKARIGPRAPSVRVFAWFWRSLMAGDVRQVERVQVWHEGRCGRCGRTLTVKDSIEAGIGPVCAAALAA